MPEEKKLTGYPSIDKPWLKYYSEEAINAPLPESTAYEYIWENNKTRLDDIALIYFNRKITYREMFERIEKTATAFLNLGVKQGDIVALMLPNIPEMIYCMYALNKIGAISDMIDLRTKGNTLIYYLQETNTSVAVICDLFAENMFDVLGKTSLEHIIIGSPFDSLPAPLRAVMRRKSRKVSSAMPPMAVAWNGFLNDKSGATPVSVGEAGDSACIFHTSGTTGLPKGVMMTNLNFNAMAAQ